MDVREYNRRAWDAEAARGCRWTVPVGPEVIEAARRGEWRVQLTEQKYAPREWFPAGHGWSGRCVRPVRWQPASGRPSLHAGPG